MKNLGRGWLGERLFNVPAFTCDSRLCHLGNNRSFKSV